MTLHEMIRSEIDSKPATNDAGQIARGLVRKLSAAHILELLTSAVRTAMRTEVRGIEAVAFRERITRQALLVKPIAFDANASAAVQQLLRARFECGRGRSVSWGDATVEDHRARIGLLAAQRDGLNETIARHEEAIRTIQECGVVCLNDVGAMEVAA